ncbi:hypothetical protein [Desemzia sp. FAM 23988]|uniref:hypothetical protein n=1 Tax=unclassified Desemzia TaxID=2685243 RepID=UPI0038869DE3
MKYLFITVLHNLELGRTYNKGIKLGNNIRISNGKDPLADIIYTNPLMETMGEHSLLEFSDNSTYLYIKGTFEEINEAREFININKNGIIVFKMLREIQAFTHKLWFVKDNSIYIRDGFLLIYDKKINSEYINAHSFKGSLSEVITNRNGKIEPVVFSDYEIKKAYNDYSAELDFSDNYWMSIDKKDEDTIGGKLPIPDIFIKEKDSNRVDRAKYFTVAARASSIIPTKLLNYISALECLFTTSTNELAHQISERVAILLGGNLDERLQYYAAIKTAYNYRSKIVHGDSIKKYYEKLESIEAVCQKVDFVLRTIFSHHTGIFSKTDEEIDNCFKYMIFRD